MMGSLFFCKQDSNCTQHNCKTQHIDEGRVYTLLKYINHPVRVFFCEMFCFTVAYESKSRHYNL